MRWSGGGKEDGPASFAYRDRCNATQLEGATMKTTSIGARVRPLQRYLLALALMISCAAQAQLFRAYLAPDGNDANPCNLQQPCRLLPAALAAVASGGEIWMLDSANYNTAPVNIAKSVTILAVPGALGSVVSAGGNAIEIATAGVKVALRNLVIVPLPGGGGTGGINMTAGASLAIENCLFANLAATGINVTANGAIVLITDSTVRGSAGEAITLTGGPKATITHATLADNGGRGVLVNSAVAGTTTEVHILHSTISGNFHGVSAISSNATAVVKMSVKDSLIVRNQNVGLISQGAATLLSASNNLIASNNTDGILTTLSGIAYASGNTVTLNNGYGLRQLTGTFFSAGNNSVLNNTSGDTTGTITAAPQQ
jgi:hypothetical protein